MSPEKQRIAIAEACGWHTIAFDKGWKATNGGETQATIPDYLNDLNAMHEAEKVLNDCISYCINLCAVVYAPLTDADSANRLWQGWWFMHATAAQRAESFLRTLGKWEE